MFNSIIRKRYESGSSNSLPYLARQGEYVLRRLPTLERVTHGTRIASAFRPGCRLVMALYLDYDENYADCCPACFSPDSGIEGVTRSCACGILYTRVAAHRSHILMYPAHRESIKQSDHPHERCECGSEQVSRQEVVLGPDPKPIAQDASEAPTFQNFGNAKNVEICTPLMVCITDLLGYTYMIPWSVVKTVKGVSFFLQWFAAGGSLFQWPQDYMLVDDSGHELAEDYWESNLYPGISIKLTLRARKFNDMRLEFTSRIEDALSTSPLYSSASNAKKATNDVCSFLNVAPSQTDLRQIVGDAVVASSPRICQASSATFEAREVVPSQWLCHVCQKKSATCSAHKRHVQSHLFALKCPQECVVCDKINGPCFVSEHVDPAQGDDESASPVSNPTSLM